MTTLGDQLPGQEPEDPEEYHPAPEGEVEVEEHEPLDPDPEVLVGREEDPGEEEEWAHEEEWADRAAPADHESEEGP